MFMKKNKIISNITKKGGQIIIVQNILVDIQNIFLSQLQ